MKAKTLILVAGLAMGGCSTLPETGPVSRTQVKSEEGHVIGYREVALNGAPRISYFTPIFGKSGTILGYEEASADGAIIRNVKGQLIGRRFSDQRSRMTNPISRGYTIIVRSQPLDRSLEGEQISVLELRSAASVGE